MIYIQMNSDYDDKAIHDAILKAANMAVDHQQIEDSKSFSVVIETDQKLQELNKQFREIDSPTDVLSFPSEEYDPDSGEIYIGDIIISYARAKQQAEEGGHSTIEEIQLLTIHGILHLLGYDHIEPDEKDEMWQIQTEILAQLGIQITFSEI